MPLTRARYYVFLYPLMVAVLGYLGYWLHGQHGVTYGWTGVAIVVLSLLGTILPVECDPPATR